jgi:hypothetical protein
MMVKPGSCAMNLPAASRSFGRLRDVIGCEAIELAILSKPDSLRTVFDRE